MDETAPRPMFIAALDQDIMSAKSRLRSKFSRKHRRQIQSFVDETYVRINGNFPKDSAQAFAAGLIFAIAAYKASLAAHPTAVQMADQIDAAFLLEMDMQAGGLAALAVRYYTGQPAYTKEDL